MGVLPLRAGEPAAVADVKRALRDACPQETWMRALAREADPRGRHPFAVAFRLLCLPDKTTARMEGVSVAAIKAFRARIGGVPMQGRSWSERLAWIVARLDARRVAAKSARGGGIFCQGRCPLRRCAAHRAALARDGLHKRSLHKESARRAGWCGWRSAAAASALPAAREARATVRIAMR